MVELVYVAAVLDVINEAREAHPDRFSRAYAVASQVVELRTELAEARTIHERLREAEYEQQCRAERAEYALAEAQRENEELRADLVWLVRRGVRATNKTDFEYDFSENERGVEVRRVSYHDGTDTDLCRAIREARRGE